MTIVASQKIKNERNTNGLTISVRERHIDHLGIEYFFSYRADADHDVDATLAANALKLHQDLVEQEIANAIQTYESGGDPLHYEAFTNDWQQITPNYQTWEQLAKPVTINFLERENKLELAYIKTTIVRMSSKTKASLWGMKVIQVSNVNGAIQEAVNSQAELDAYTPFFVEDILP